MDLRFLTSNKKFAPFFWTQFLGAFNDNFFKNTLVVLVAFRGIQILGMDSASLVAVAGGVFILPFFLFSALAGQFADKYEKSKLVRITKITEFGIMTIAAIGFLTHSYLLLFAVLFLMGTQSTFFGPIKYSVIPDLVKKDQLIEGNAFVELGTFLAILLGTICGGVISTYPGADWLTGIGVVGFALLGYLTSRGIPLVPVASPDLKIEWNPFPEFLDLWSIIRRKPAIFNSVLAISWFWFFGAGILSVLPVYVKEYIGADEQVVTVFLAMFTLGIGIGSIICERLSYKRVEIGIVPLGSLGMTLFLFDLYLVGSPWAGIPPGQVSLNMFLSSISGWRLMIDFLVMSIFGGIFIVPLYTLLQERSRPKERSRVIAANNIINALFMVIASVAILLFYRLGLNTAQVFAILAMMNIVVTVYIYFVVPEFTLRFYSWLLAKIMYRVKITGLDNVPQDKAFVLAANHISFVDWLIVSGACKVPVRYVMYYKFFEIPIVRFFMKQYKVIPIASRKEDPMIMEQAFIAVSEELKDNNGVCIFPEGEITRTGRLSPFRPGILRIIERDPVPVVPVVLKGFWGSLFSRKEKRGLGFRPRVEIKFLKRIKPSELSLEGLESVLAVELGEEPPHQRKN